MRTKNQTCRSFEVGAVELPKNCGSLLTHGVECSFVCTDRLLLESSGWAGTSLLRTFCQSSTNKVDNGYQPVGHLSQGSLSPSFFTNTTAQLGPSLYKQWKTNKLGKNFHFQ